MHSDQERTSHTYKISVVTVHPVDGNFRYLYLQTLSFDDVRYS